MVPLHEAQAQAGAGETSIEGRGAEAGEGDSGQEAELGCSKRGFLAAFVLRKGLILAMTRGVGLACFMGFIKSNLIFFIRLTPSLQG